MDSEFEIVKHRTASLARTMNRGFARSLALVRREIEFAQENAHVLAVAERHALPVGIPPHEHGRPRGMDYARLAVMLAAGASQREAATRLGVSKSAVTMALARNHALRRSVRRLAHWSTSATRP